MTRVLQVLQVMCLAWALVQKAQRLALPVADGPARVDVGAHMAWRWADSAKGAFVAGLAEQLAAELQPLSEDSHSREAGADAGLPEQALSDVRSALQLAPPEALAPFFGTTAAAVTVALARRWCLR